MEFEWDEGKNGLNKLNHKLDFADAVHIFLDKSRIEREDVRRDYGEQRFQTLGMTDFGVLVVVYTLRDSNNVVRLISARKVNKREKKAYDLGYLKPYVEAHK